MFPGLEAEVLLSEPSPAAVEISRDKSPSSPSIHEFEPALYLQIHSIVKHYYIDLAWEMGWPISPTDSAAIAAALAIPDYVPAGVTQAFLEQNRDQAPVQTIIFVGVVVAITVLLRCYARGVLMKDFKLDDWLALTTMVGDSPA